MSKQSTANPFETEREWEELRDRIIGLGEHSFHKSYYPALRRNMAEINKLLQAIDQTTVGIVICSHDGIMEFVNPAQCTMTGYTVAELVGAKPSLYRSDTTDPEVYNDMWAKLTAGCAWRGELLNRRKSGETFWVQLSVTPIRDETGAITHFVGINEDISDRRLAEERQKLMLHELNHRVKNTLATVLAIAGQTSRTTETTSDFMDAFGARLMSLSRTHNLLTEHNWQGAPLDDVLRQAVAPYAGGDSQRVLLEGPPIPLGPIASVTLGLAFHELATNAAKYGALSSGAGRVRVHWYVQGQEQLRLEWREEGGPPVAPPRRQGFGSIMLQRCLAHELAGLVDLAFPPEGVRCVMEMLMARISFH